MSKITLVISESSDSRNHPMPSRSRTSRATRRCNRARRGAHAAKLGKARELAFEMTTTAPRNRQPREFCTCRGKSPRPDRSIYVPGTGKQWHRRQKALPNAAGAQCVSTGERQIAAAAAGRSIAAVWRPSGWDETLRLGIGIGARLLE